MITQFVQKNKYEVTRLEEEWIILDTHSYTITRLNEVGGFCWSLLSKPVSMESLISAVTDKYDSGVNVHEDIEAFLSDLISIGLVQHAY